MVGMEALIRGRSRAEHVAAHLPVARHGSGRLVIIETGAAAHELEMPPPDCEHTVVVLQSPGESFTRLARRVRVRLLEIACARLQLTWVLLVLGSRFDDAANRARLQIGRSLRRHARSCADVLTLALHAPESLQPEVFQLLDIMIAELAGEEFSTHIRFDRAAGARWPQ